MLSPVVYTVPGMLSSSAAVASSFVAPQFAMFPAPTSTSAVVVAAADTAGRPGGGPATRSSDLQAMTSARATRAAGRSQRERVDCRWLRDTISSRLMLGSPRVRPDGASGAAHRLGSAERGRGQPGCPRLYHVVRRSRKAPREYRAYPIGEPHRDATPQRSRHVIQRPLGSGCCVQLAGRPLEPGKRGVHSAPLMLELVRSSARRAPAEIEHPNPLRDQVLHEGPVEQHVGHLVVILAQRRHPRDLEFAAPYEAAARGQRLPAPVHHAEYRGLAEDSGDSLEQSPRQNRRSEIPHIDGKDLIERLDLIGPEARLHPLFLRATDLPAP